MSGQYQLQQQANDAGVVIVTCPSDGKVLLHYKGQYEVTCPHCGTTSDASDFPDLFLEED